MQEGERLRGGDVVGPGDIADQLRYVRGGASLRGRDRIRQVHDAGDEVDAGSITGYPLRRERRPSRVQDLLTITEA